MPFGLNPTGFTKKTIDDVLAAIRTKQLTTFGSAFAAQLDTSVAGQLNGIIAAEISDLWDLAESVWRSRFPATAEGMSLDYIGQETGAVRNAATQSTGFVTFSGTNGTPIPQGTQVRVALSDARFETTAPGVIAGGVAIVPIRSIEYGPILAPAGQISELVTAIGGVTTISNALDIAVGRNLEMDAEFRLRRMQLLRQAGESTIDAIRSDLLALVGVSEVIVFNNPTDFTDADGLPPHSFEAVLLGGVNQVIFDEVFNSSPAGIQSFGTTVGAAIDSSGISHVVKFSRPTSVLMYGDIVIVRDPAVYGGGNQAAGDALVKQAIVDYWLSFDQRIGKDVITNAFYGTIYSIPGVLEITSLKIDDVFPPLVVTNTVIPSRSIALFDTSRITVAS